MDLKVSLSLISIFIIIFTVISFFVINKYWVNLLIGSILFGTFFGIVKNGLNGQKEDINMTFLLIGCFFIWFFLTKISGINIVKETVIKSPQEELEENNEQKGILNKDKPVLSTNISNLSYVILLAVIFILLLFFLKFSYLPIGFFLFICVIFSYLTNKKLIFDEKVEIISYTISYGIIFGIFAPLFLFNNFNMKNTITNTLLFFTWATLTQSTSKFLSNETNYISRY